MSSSEYQKVVAVDHALHTISVATLAGTLAGLLPPLAAFVAILWYAIQIYESKTVQRWVHRREPHHPVHRPNFKSPKPKSEADWHL